MMEGMRVLSCFSGIDAHSVGLSWAGMDIVGQIEIEPFCQLILEQHFPHVPKWTDIKQVSIDDIRATCGRIDLITGGFPCQSISVAGHGKGIGTEEAPTEKSGLFWELKRLIDGLRPDYLLLENVSALRSRGADTVFTALQESGYTCWPFVVQACAVGFPHQRERESGLSESEQLWSTPRTSQDHKPACESESKRRSPALNTQVMMWPTPTASLASSEPAPMKEGVQWWKQSRAARNLTAIAQSFDQHQQSPQRWATPAVNEPGITIDRIVDKDGNTPTHFNQRLYDKETGRVIQDGLPQQVEMVKMWPTPASRDWRDDGDCPSAQSRKSPCLPASVNMIGKSQELQQSDKKFKGLDKSRLNYRWVSQLMGLPADYLDLSLDIIEKLLKPSGTPTSH